MLTIVRSINVFISSWAPASLLAVPVSLVVSPESTVWCILFLHHFKSLFRFIWYILYTKMYDFSLFCCTHENIWKWCICFYYSKLGITRNSLIHYYNHYNFYRHLDVLFVSILNSNYKDNCYGSAVNNPLKTEHSSILCPIIAAWQYINYHPTLLCVDSLTWEMGPRDHIWIKYVWRSTVFIVHALFSSCIFTYVNVYSSWAAP